MNKKLPQIFALFLTSIFLIALSGCPGPESREDPTPSDNILDIPPLGTEFIYEGEDVNWDWQPHPRVMICPEGLESLMQRDNALRGDLNGLARIARYRMGPYSDYREAVGPLATAFVYKSTGYEGYLELVRQSLTWLLDFTRLVKYPEGDNIAFLQQAMSLAGVYDLLYDDFTDEEITKIETVLRETVFHSLAYKVTEYDKEVNFWANDPDTNYYLIFHSTAGLVSIILKDIEPDAEALAEHCWLRVQDSMDAFADQNGWVEGLTYLDFCWGQSACYFLLALERNSDLKPFDEPWFEASLRWAQWGALPDSETIACFGDNEPENYSVGSYIARILALTGNPLTVSSLNNIEFTSELALDIPIFNAMCISREITSVDLSDKLVRFNELSTDYLQGLEWGFISAKPASDQWEFEDTFYLAFKSGVSGYDHNHLDQGSMILAAYSEILLSDPGRGGPDIIRQDPYINCLFEAGLGHNTLIFNDGCYLDLELFPDNPEYFSEKGTITHAYQDEKIIQYATDNSGLYPTEPLQTYQRTFIYIKPEIIPGYELGALILADHVVLESPENHSFLFHTPGDVTLIETGNARLGNNGARLDYFGFCTVPTIDKTERQETGMESRDSTCYFRSTENSESETDWLHILIPKRANDPLSLEPEISADEDFLHIGWESFEVTLTQIPDIGWVLIGSEGE